MSTIGPDNVAALRDRAPEGVEVLDVPVLGGVSDAAGGTLTLYFGAGDASFARWRDVLAPLGTPVHVGPPGAGAAMKLVANSTLAGLMSLIGEALALADGFGLHRETAFRILAETPLGAQAERRREALTTMSFPPRFALRLAHKDARLVVDEASAGGTDVRIAAAVSSWFADAERAGAGTDDYTAVLAFILGQSHHLDV
jgi:3-hydroxyisobutyrate dehydrogenase/2-hydroxy-3-oxopropionate reductase